jgi:hypothetical protein
MSKNRHPSSAYPVLSAGDRLAALASLLAKAAIRSSQKEDESGELEPVLKQNPVNMETSVCHVRIEMMSKGKPFQPGLFDEEDL